MARILIVDDEPFLRRILSCMLAGAGYEVEVAEDGEQAWDRIQGAEPPDLLISDLMMPGITGIELVRRVRARGGAYLPILILTARGQGVDKDEAHESGADAFMAKPFNARALTETVQKMLAGTIRPETGIRPTGTDG